MAVTRCDFFRALLKKGVWSSCAAVGLGKVSANQLSDQRAAEIIPLRWIFDQTTLDNLLERSRIFVYAPCTIKFGWRVAHAVNN